FRREDANPTGIWGECMIVKLHCISHFEPSKAPRDGFIASVVNSVCLRRAPCPFLGSPTHYHRHFPDVGDRGRNRPADRLRWRENRGIELRAEGSTSAGPAATTSG